MRLIIDIPEEEWLFVKAKIVSEDDSYIDRAIANGIPFDKIRDEISALPEDMGNIIDIQTGEIVGKYISSQKVMQIIDKTIAHTEKHEPQESEKSE